MVTLIAALGGLVIASAAALTIFVRFQSYWHKSSLEFAAIQAIYDEEKGKVAADVNKIDELRKVLDNCNQRLKDEQELLQEKITELEKRTKQLGDAERTIEQQDEKSSFVAAVVNAQPEQNAALDEYKRLLEHDYQAYANKNDSFAEEARAMKQLLRKNIVAIGGAFSSGKSSFMNSFFVQDKVTLPVGMDQTTAVASYVMHGEETEITGYSYIGGKFSVPERIFSLFSYGKDKKFKKIAAWYFLCANIHKISLYLRRVR